MTMKKLSVVLATCVGCGGSAGGSDSRADGPTSGDGTSSTGASSDGPSTGVDDGSSTAVPDDDWSDLLEPVAGSRLRPVRRVSDDGAEAHVGWYDTLLEGPCTFRQASDGELRCLPSEQMSEPWRYADANCSEPAVPGFELPETGTVSFVRSGCFGATYYEIGEVVTSTIYYNANGPCEVFSDDPDFRRVSVFPVDGFVAATRTPADGDSRIVPLVLEADDGARQIAGAWDREREEEVAPDGAPEAALWRGLYLPSVSVIYYADAACSERVALEECVPSAVVPRTGRDLPDPSCATTPGHYDLGEEVDALWTMQNGTCTPAAPHASLRSFRVGDPIDDSVLAPAAALEDGGDRLRHYVHANPEGAAVLPSRDLYDALLGDARCDWRAEAMPGEFSCIPAGAARLLDSYVDAACTQRTAQRFVYGDDCAAAATYAVVLAVIAEVIEQIAAPGDYHLDDQGDCVEIPPDGGSDGGFDTDSPDFYLVGDPLDVTPAHAIDEIE